MDWTAVDPSAADRGLALTLVRRAWTLFFNHGWQLGQHPLLPGLPPEAALPDSPLPSPSATVIRITRELADPKRDKDLLAKVHQALALGYGVASEAPFGYAGTVLALAER
jgi:hypothetical protein